MDKVMSLLWYSCQKGHNPREIVKWGTFHSVAAEIVLISTNILEEEKQTKRSGHRLGYSIYMNCMWSFDTNTSPVLTTNHFFITTIKDHNSFTIYLTLFSTMRENSFVWIDPNCYWTMWSVLSLCINHCRGMKICSLLPGSTHRVGT